MSSQLVILNWLKLLIKYFAHLVYEDEMETFCFASRTSEKWSGAPNGKLWEKDLKTTTKHEAFWSHFKHFGRLLGKIYLLLTPNKTDGRLRNSRHQIPSDTLNWLFPSNTFLPRTYYSSQISSQQKFAWRTDILKSRSIGCPWMIIFGTLAWMIEIHNSFFSVANRLISIWR